MSQEYTVKTFREIPTQRPETPLLDQVNAPSDLRLLEQQQLPKLAEELRSYLLYSVGQTGGHFGAGLGVLELTVALHYCYKTPEDSLVWDVGHQTYPHKILTGRREQMLSIRQKDGLSGFPKREESEFDTFGVGHSSTSISAALGMALGHHYNRKDNKTVAVIGDGAMTAGMAFEALTHAAHTESDMLVILNDNNMSISRNVGGLATYFSKIWASKTYNNLREGSKKVLSKIPHAWEFARKTEEHMKGLVSPATLFEELGFNYVGPMDGHNLPELINTLQNLRDIPGPKLLHLMTQKGKGFSPAEDDPVGFHALAKIDPKPQQSSATPKAKSPKYQDVFGQWLCDMAAKDEKLLGITPAMCEGSGMIAFRENYSERFHDVAIAEQHAVTLAAGLACEGMKPVVAIYSTFLQRAYDQLVHDVALQKLDVTFAIDRAGLVGEDGPTHAGSFDLSFLRCIPNMVIAAPADENECRQLLYTCYQHSGPSAVRYPRGTGPGVDIKQEMEMLPIGKGRLLRQNTMPPEEARIAILNFGALLDVAEDVSGKLNSTLCDMRFIKPLDITLIEQIALEHDLIVTLEDNAIAGGAGSGVLEHLSSQGYTTPVLPLGLPDEFVEHGTRSELLQLTGLDVENITVKIQSWLEKSSLKLSPSKTA